MSNSETDSRLKALLNILALETQNGFLDWAVTGGLDRFLETLTYAQADHPGFQNLAEHGMFAVGYRGLNVVKRSRWVEEVKRLLMIADPSIFQALSYGDHRVGGSPKHRKSVGSKSVTLTIDSPTVALHSVNRSNAVKLDKLGVRTCLDLIQFYPHRHIDYSARRFINQLKDGEDQTIVVALWDARQVKFGKGGRVKATEATVGDETGNVRVLWWGAPWMVQTLQRAQDRAKQSTSNALRIALSGRVSLFNRRLQMESPEWEILSDDPEMANLIHTGRLVPVYSSTDGLPQRTIRRAVREAMSIVFSNENGHVDKYMDQEKTGLPDPIPRDVRDRLVLMPLNEAISQVHYPDNSGRYELARRRLAFDELFVLQLAVMLSRQTGPNPPKGLAMNPNPKLIGAFLKSLPFELTGGQRTAMDQALADISIAARPMSRLLQGDVGAGKTVVALALLLACVGSGYQCVMMAPTEVLAEQHFLNVRLLLSGLNEFEEFSGWFSVTLDGYMSPIRVGLLTGSTRAKIRRELQSMARDGSLNILVGTHAVIQEDIEIPGLGLAVVDEQHRFGVKQRQALRGKGGVPHVLVMSATPIPRTLALTLYGDLDVSVIPELPSGRRPVMTRIVPPERGEDAEAFLVAQAKEGRQSFVVCPLIDDSEAVQARAVISEHRRLQETTLAELRVGLLHGRMSVMEKHKTMEEFRNGEMDVLVATSVIEVGLDIPNATVMLIQGADRFGLAQLHQLRGRVGRSFHQSYCLLLTDSVSEDVGNRLGVLVGSNDGFEISEADLRMRGPGDFFGTRQSGLPPLRMARLSDRDILTVAKEEANQLLSVDPSLTKNQSLAAGVRSYTMRGVTDERG